jgi:hypothetical protein
MSVGKAQLPTRRFFRPIGMDRTAANRFFR